MAKHRSSTVLLEGERAATDTGSLLDERRSRRRSFRRVWAGGKWTRWGQLPDLGWMNPGWGTCWGCGPGSGCKSRSSRGSFRRSASWLGRGLLAMATWNGGMEPRLCRSVWFSFLSSGSCCFGPKAHGKVGSTLCFSCFRDLWIPLSRGSTSSLLDYPLSGSAHASNTPPLRSHVVQEGEYRRSVS